MEIVQLITLFLGIGGLFFWNRSESRNDMRHMDAKIETLIREIQNEMKDFHGKLCSLDERTKK